MNFVQNSNYYLDNVHVYDKKDKLMSENPHLAYNRSAVEIIHAVVRCSRFYKSEIHVCWNRVKRISEFRNYLQKFGFLDASRNSHCMVNITTSEH